MQPWDKRSRFSPPSIKEYYRQDHGAPGFNLRSHDSDRTGQHLKYLLYTTGTTLSTDTGSPFYPPFSGRITACRANVAGAPVTNPLEVHLWKNGVSIFGGTGVTIPAAVLFGYKRLDQTKIYINVDDKLQVDITTISSATGPLTFLVEYIPG